LQRACIALFIALTGCNDACEEVAASLRQCCARGPAELREACEAHADALEQDGNAEACADAAAQGDFAGCEP